MKKKEISKLEDAQAAWNDTITEGDVMAKLGVSQETLRKMRRDGVIKKFRYATPSKTGNPNRPGKKPMYSLIELTELFSPSLQTA